MFRSLEYVFLNLLSELFIVYKKLYPLTTTIAFLCFSENILLPPTLWFDVERKQK